MLGMAPGTWFPVAGKTFALLSTGHSADVTANDSTTQFPMSFPRHNNRLLNEQKNELMEVQFTLQVPERATCLSFDYTFYTADLPPGAFVGKPERFYPYNDTFTAQLNDTTISVLTASGSSPVVAPNNFALSRHGEIISVNTIDQVNTALALASPAGTTYPGSFPCSKRVRMSSRGQ